MWLHYHAPQIDDWSQELRMMMNRYLQTNKAKMSSVGCYAPLMGEPNLLPVVNEWPTLQWSLPFITDAKKNEMQFVDISLPLELENLDAGPWGTRQPLQGSPVAPKTIFVPGLGFDRNGIRLGHGKGFYDKYFEQHPHCHKVGICFEGQLVGELPQTQTDIPVNAIITDKRIIEIQKE